MSKYKKISNLIPPKKEMLNRGIKNNINGKREEIKSNSKNEMTTITKFNNEGDFNISYEEKNSFEDYYDDDGSNFYNNLQWNRKKAVYLVSKKTDLWFSDFA